MSKKEEFIRMMDSKIDKWSAEIYALALKANKARMQTRAEYYKQIEVLRKKQNIAHKQLLVLGQAEECTWESMKPGIEMTWESIDATINSVKSSFK
jgi:hypothetical protein